MLIIVGLKTKYAKKSKTVVNIKTDVSINFLIRDTEAYTNDAAICFLCVIASNISFLKGPRSHIKKLYN